MFKIQTKKGLRRNEKMDYRTIATVKLVDMIAMATHKGDQETVNDIALELTKRI